MNIEKIESSLWDAGYRRDSGIKKGWYRKYATDGPPGLTSDEREINDRGGIYYGKDSIGILMEEIKEAKAYIAGREEDEMSQQDRWWKNWIREAEEALSS